MPIVVERVLAATDFSPAGQRAVDVAAEWARRARAQLRIVHVTPSKGSLRGAWGLKPSVANSIQHHATNALKRAADSADPGRAIELSTGVLVGPAARNITRAAREFGADLVVVGARGEREDQPLGGTSGKLLEAAETPLLLVRRPRHDALAGVVAALDLSPSSPVVLEWAHFAAADQHLYAYHAYDVPFAARLEAYGLSPSAIDVYSADARTQSDAALAALVSSIGRAEITTRVVERGEPSALLRRFIDSVRPSLIVLGRRQSRSSQRSRLGSVGRFIASGVQADVLAV